MDVSDSAEVYERGIAVRDEMLGSEHGRAKVESAGRVHARLRGDGHALLLRRGLDARAQLPRAQRSMITIAMLIALGRAARDPRAREGRAHERRDEGGDQRDHHALRDLLRGPGGGRRATATPRRCSKSSGSHERLAAGPARRLRRPRQHGRADGAQPRRGRLRAHGARRERRAAGADRGRGRRRRRPRSSSDFADVRRRRHDAARRPRRRGGDARVGRRHRLRAAPGSRASST